MVATLEALLRLRDEMSGPLRNADRAAKQMAEPSGGMGSLAKTALGTAGGFIAAQASLATLEKGLSASVGSAMAYEHQMAQVRALTGATGEDTDKLKASIRDMQNTLPKSSQELGAGAYFILSSGITDVADASKVLEIAAKASTVGLGDTSVVADALTTVLNAYGKEAGQAGRVTDVLMQAVKDGKVEASGFAGVLGTVVPMAAHLGISFEEVAANLATFTRLGVSAEEAATGLRGVMNQLLSPSAQAKELLAGVGLTADELRAAIKERGLAVTLQDLIAKFHGNEEALSTLFPEVRGLTNVLATAGVQADAYNQILGNMETATGNLDRGFKDISETTQFKVQKAMNDLNVALMEMGTDVLPAVAVAAEGMAMSIQGTVDIINALITPVKELLNLYDLYKRKVTDEVVPATDLQVETFRDFFNAGQRMNLSVQDNLTGLGQWATQMVSTKGELAGVLEKMGLTSDEIAIATSAYEGVTQAEKDAAGAAKNDVLPALGDTKSTLGELTAKADEARSALLKMFKEPTAEEAAAELALSQLQLQMAGLTDKLVPLTDAQRQWLDSLKLSGDQADIAKLMAQGLTAEEATMYVNLRDNLLPEQRDHLDLLTKTRDAASQEAQAKINSLPSQDAWKQKIDEQTGAVLGLQGAVNTASGSTLPAMNTAVDEQVGHIIGMTFQVQQYSTALNQIPPRIRTDLEIFLSQIGAPGSAGEGPTHGQHGLHGWVDKPTLLLVGEGGGRERVDVTPAHQMASGLSGGTQKTAVVGAAGSGFTDLHIHVHSLVPPSPHQEEQFRGMVVRALRQAGLRRW